MVSTSNNPTNVNWVRVNRAYLSRFWREFGGKVNNGVGFPEGPKIAELIRLSEIDLLNPGRPVLKLKREHFDEWKPKLHSLKKYGECFVCGAPAHCRHHIIQLQHGGINHRSNLASLCDSCHAQVHPWLA